MKLKLTSKFVFTFLTLTFFMHELHELAHTGIGRLICGCWGERDFNVWSLCEGCPEQKPYSVIATFVGPLFSFTMIWLGTLLMCKAKSDDQKTLGFSLVFSNMPFARIFGAATGGGDEVWGLNLLWHNQNLAWIVGLVIVLAITIYPLYKSFKLIKNESALVWFLVFFMIPNQIDHWVVLILLNKLVQNGLLNNYWIMGSPILVTIWTIIVALVYFMTRKNIHLLLDKENSSEPIVDGNSIENQLKESQHGCKIQ